MIKIKSYNKDAVKWVLLTSSYTKSRYRAIVGILIRNQIPYKSNSHKDIEYQILVPLVEEDRAFDLIKNVK